VTRRTFVAIMLFSLLTGCSSLQVSSDYDPAYDFSHIRKIAILVQQPELRKAMGEKARQTILETYTWEKHAEKLSRICFNAYLHRNRNAKEKARS